MEITIDATGIAEALRAADPQQAYQIVTLWFLRAIEMTESALRAAAPGRLRGKVRHMQDGYSPHRWARVYVASPLAHLIEGGTGALGAGGFAHKSKHWPNTSGIMLATGLPQAQALLVARSIGLRGGNPPRPFMAPTWAMVGPRVETLADEVAIEVLGR